LVFFNMEEGQGRILRGFMGAIEAVLVNDPLWSTETATQATWRRLGVVNCHDSLAV
jgi:hypothetical protein